MKQANSSPDRLNPPVNKDDLKRPYDIQERTFRFAVKIVQLVGFLEDQRFSHRTIRTQILRSGTSIGANMEEAGAAQSKRDFIHKCNIALKEARETFYWIRLLCRTVKCPSNVLTKLASIEKESDEIKRIIGKIIVNAKKNELV